MNATQSIIQIGFFYQHVLLLIRVNFLPEISISRIIILSSWQNHFKDFFELILIRSLNLKDSLSSFEYFKFHASVWYLVLKTFLVKKETACAWMKKQDCVTNWIVIWKSEHGFINWLTTFHDISLYVFFKFATVSYLSVGEMCFSILKHVSLSIIIRSWGTFVLLTLLQADSGTFWAVPLKITFVTGDKGKKLLRF